MTKDPTRAAHLPEDAPILLVSASRSAPAQACTLAPRPAVVRRVYTPTARASVRRAIDCYASAAEPQLAPTLSMLA